jgi:hypothetical protein
VVEDQGPSALQRIAAISALLGVLLYGYLTYVYERFYSQLAVDAGDVGLGYATTLARSSGLILIVVVSTAITLFLARFVLGIILGLIDQSPGLVLFSALFVFLLWVAIPVLWYPFTEPAREVDIAVRQVQAGLPVAPVRIFGVVTVMALRADAAVVQPSGEPGASPAANALGKRKGLVYLGQSNNTAVFFDSGVDQSVYVPADAVVMQLQRPPPREGRSPLCRLTYSRRWWQWPLPAGLRTALTRQC